MSAATTIPTGPLSDLIQTIETSPIADRKIAAHALGFVRDGVITGEGPTPRAGSIFRGRWTPLMRPGARAF